jgi:hypothetical protein
MRQKWSEREYQAFKEWEKKFHRPSGGCLASLIACRLSGF